MQNIDIIRNGVCQCFYLSQLLLGEGGANGYCLADKLRALEERISRISFAPVGAQLPFSMRAILRFCRLWFARSCSRFSIVTNMPALYVGAANTR